MGIAVIPVECWHDLATPDKNAAKANLGDRGGNPEFAKTTDLGMALRLKSIHEKTSSGDGFDEPRCPRIGP